MYIAIYTFEVKENQTAAFIEAWEALTKFFMNHAHSLGSRLHRVDESLYLAYAQWPSKDLYEAAGEKMPPEADKWRNQMRNACEKVNTLHKMEVVNDLLVK